MPHMLSRTEEITRALRDDILRGQYRAGERVPSERDLAARFATSRGTVREALKKLEQLGIASIQPGGARVVPVQECTLDVLGPLLDLNEIPDAALMGQVLDIGTLLIAYAAETAVERGDSTALARVEATIDEILAAEPGELAMMRVPRLLGRAFAQASGNLVLLLIINGLRTQIPDPRRMLGGPPRLEPESLKRIAADIKAAVARRDGAAAGAFMRELMGLMRAAARGALRSHRSKHDETLRSHRPNTDGTLRSHRSNAGETPFSPRPNANETPISHRPNTNETQFSLRSNAEETNS